jgi:hypothetical protein
MYLIVTLLLGIWGINKLTPGLEESKKWDKRSIDQKDDS